MGEVLMNSIGCSAGRFLGVLWVLSAALSGASPALSARIVFRPPVPLADVDSHLSSHVTIENISPFDMDGDGDLDLVVGFGANDSSHGVPSAAWLENQGLRGRPRFTVHLIENPGGVLGEPVRTIRVADMDGDGDPDILAGGYGFVSGGLFIYENTWAGPSGFQRKRLLWEYSWSAVLADLDGDSDLDVLNADSWLDRISWLENNGLHPTSYPQHLITDDPDGPGFHQFEGFPDGVRSLAVGDMDGDGDVDILSASALDDTIAWYRNDGGSPPTFLPIEISTSANGARRVATADINDDGHKDAVSLSRRDDKIAWYENDGSALPSFAERIVSEGPDGHSGPAEGFNDKP